MRKSKYSAKKGSLIVETAIFLPIFIISILLLSALIKSISLQTAVFEAYSDEGRKSSVESYTFHHLQEGTPEILKQFASNTADRTIYLKRIQSGLEKRRIDSKWVTLDRYSPDIEKHGLTNLTRAEICYHMRIPLPISKIHEIQIWNTVYYRTWEGETLSGELFSFDRMMVDEDGNLVCIFPNAGKKYHKITCRYVNSYAVKTAMSSEILRKYDACPLCREREAQIGETVFIFPYGNSYHSASCPAVDKYVIEMDRQDALQKRYTACSICGG